MAGNTPTDAMITRLEKEVEERSTFIDGVIANAQDAERDLTDNEKELTAEARSRLEACEQQLEYLYESRERTTKARQRVQDVHNELHRMRREVDSGPVEYRSAGEYLLDAIQAGTGSREARERLEVYERVAAHQKTGDNPGVVPDPIVGEVVNFIDAARPIVGFVGPQGMPSASWHRPKVTQHTTVGAQGAAGGAADEKTELVSQKMIITRLPASAKTFGGYANVSRQNVDFSTPSALDIVINDLAAQYAIETEAEIAAALATTTTPAVTWSQATGQDGLAIAIWEAAATAYNSVKGQGRLGLAVAPDRLKDVGPLFSPVNPRDAQGDGFLAGRFGQGVMGNISGIPVIMSAGLAAGEMFQFSTAAIEAFEQRVGTLQAIEPSVLGTQVAYAGYFTALKIEDGGIVPFSVTA